MVELEVYLRLAELCQSFFSFNFFTGYGTIGFIISWIHSSLYPCNIYQANGCHSIPKHNRPIPEFSNTFFKCVTLHRNVFYVLSLGSSVLFHQAQILFRMIKMLILSSYVFVCMGREVVALVFDICQIVTHNSGQKHSLW